MTEPATGPSAAPAATRNPTAMILGALGAVLIAVGAFVNWISDTDTTSGLDTPIEVFWSTEFGEATFLSSAGFVLLIIAAITLIGAVIVRSGITLLGGALGLLAFVLIVITLLRLEVFDLGIGDFAIGLWSVAVGGILGIVAGLMGRRVAA